MRLLTCLTALLLSASSALAADRELSFGLGYSEFSRPGAKNGALLSFEYRHRPFYTKGALSARFGAAMDVQETGDVFLGAGINGLWDLGQAWFIEAGVMPGVFLENVSLNDLGSTFEIRSQLSIGRHFSNGTALSLSLSHKSNASTASINPGLNSVLVRWHVPF